MPPRNKRCGNGKCDYQPMPNTYRQKCTVCGDVYPCRHPCDHYDCQDDRIAANHPFEADLIKHYERNKKDDDDDDGQRIAAPPGAASHGGNQGVQGGEAALHQPGDDSDHH